MRGKWEKEGCDRPIYSSTACMILLTVPVQTAAYAYFVYILCILCCVLCNWKDNMQQREKVLNRQSCAPIQCIHLGV